MIDLPIAHYDETIELSLSDSLPDNLELKLKLRNIFVPEYFKELVEITRQQDWLYLKASEMSELLETIATYIANKHEVAVINGAILEAQSSFERKLMFGIIDYTEDGTLRIKLIIAL